MCFASNVCTWIAQTTPFRVAKNSVSVDYWPGRTPLRRGMLGKVACLCLKVSQGDSNCLRYEFGPSFQDLRGRRAFGALARFPCGSKWAIGSHHMGLGQNLLANTGGPCLLVHSGTSSGTLPPAAEVRQGGPGGGRNQGPHCGTKVWGYSVSWARLGWLALGRSGLVELSYAHNT